MGMTAAGSETAAAPTARIASLYGPRRITDPVDAVLASVVPAESMPQVEVNVAGDGRHASGQVNGSELWSIAIPRRRWLEALTGQIVATNTVLLRRLVFVHAGVVELAGRACVLVGDSGAGKTSTVAALLARGAKYLSDEVALLDPDTSDVLPFHLPMAIKPWTARAAGPLPAGDDVAGQGSVVFRLPAALGRACPIGTVVLLRRAGRGGMAPISRAEVLLRLAQQPSSFRYPGRTEEAFRAWAQGLRNADCLELTADHPAAFAPALVRRLRGWA
jgi:hypothetical protein